MSGAAAAVMFAMVTAIGIRSPHKVDFENNHNLLIVAVSLSAGLIPWTLCPWGIWRVLPEKNPRN